VFICCDTHKSLSSAATGTKKCFCDTHKSLSSAATGTKKCFCDTHKSLSSAATGTQECFCDTHKSLSSAAFLRGVFGQCVHLKKIHAETTSKYFLEKMSFYIYEIYREF
jgi:hypothetical protein